MDYRNERLFVQTYIRKDRRDRLLYELTDPVKRYDGLERFCHHAADLLDMNKVMMTGEDLERTDRFQSFADKHKEDCVLLSPDGNIDGLVLPFRNAVDTAVACFDAVIILGDRFALVMGEVMKGGRGKHLLADK